MHFEYVRMSSLDLLYESERLMSEGVDRGKIQCKCGKFLHEVRSSRRQPVIEPQVAVGRLGSSSEDLTRLERSTTIH